MQINMEKMKKFELLLQLLSEDQQKEKPELSLSDGTLSTLLSQKLDNLQGISEKIYKVIVTASKDLLSLDEASEYLTISKSDLYKKTSQKIIQFYKPGKHIYFKKSDLDNFILANPQK